MLQFKRRKFLWNLFLRFSHLKKWFFAEETFDLPLNVADLIFAIQEKQPNFFEFNLRLKDFNISIFQNIPLVLQKKKKKKKKKRKEKNYVDNKLD